MLRSLTIENWPAADREAWSQALQPKQGWRRGGAAARLRPATTADLERRYGYFLQYCLHIERLGNANAFCAALVTQNNVAAYVAHVQTFWASTTVYTATQKLWQIARLLAPSRDFSWLREIVLDLKALAEPSVQRPIVTAQALTTLGLSLYRQGVEALEADPKKAAKLIRDGLIVALLTACPLRAKNFARLELSRSIKREHGSWWIELAAEETKNGRPDLRPVPDYLVTPLETYLLHARPALMKAAAPAPGVKQPPLEELVGPLWFSCFGRPLDEQGLHIITTRVTRAPLGAAVNPHAFRSAAAMTAAWKGSKTPHLASAILQHSDPRITDKHYNRAATFEAAEAYRKMLRGG